MFFSFSTKKEHADNSVKKSFDLPPQSQYTSSTSKANTDFLDRQLFEKADLDFIPGLDYDMGPVYIPSKITFIYFFDFNAKKYLFFIAPLDKLPGLDEATAAAKARADEEARKKAEAAAAEANAKKKEQSSRIIKPILPHSSMFIFSSTNP